MARRAKLPPGPVPILFLGNLPQLALYVWQEGSLAKALRVCQKEFGDIFTLWMGPLPTVHIASLELSHELMVKQGNNFAERWSPFLFQFIRNGAGILFSNGDYWQDQRRFTLQTLRNFGVGRNLIEERIMMEFDLRMAELDAKIKKNKNHVENAKTLMNLMVGSIINRLLFSVRFTESNQDEFFRLKDEIDNASKRINITDLYMAPWMMNIPVIKSSYEKFMQPIVNLLEFVQKQVNERKEAVRSGEHIIVDEGTDYVDAYMKKIENEKDNPSSGFTERSLLINLLDIWIAGQETTTTTLMWGLIFLLNHPEVTEKIRKEIQTTTHSQRALTLKDKNDTPYFNAAINKTNIGDYVIEPGVPITAELSLIMSNEKDFKNSEKFYPERFLENEKLEQNVIPFGIGKRACPGESLARAEIYLLLGNLILKYNFEAVDKVPPMVTSYRKGLFNINDDFSIKFIPSTTGRE
ncbi:unnamed protein product [Auanema sp. JU1783]|nr:unnamed protein product [Auanema sp. JU1783]